MAQIGRRVLYLALALSWPLAVQAQEAAGNGPVDDPASLLEQATAEIWRGNYARADALQQKYLEIAGRTEAYRIARANLLARSGKSDAALTETRELLASQPDHYDLNLTHTLALHGNHQPGEALSSLETLDRLGPERPETQGAHLQVETPQRTQAGLDFDYADFSDSIRRERTKLHAAFSPTPEARIGIETARLQLRADSGSGLEPLTGSRSIELDEERVWARYQFNARFSAGASIGQADNGRGRGMTTHGLDLGYRVSDDLKLGFEYGKDVLPVSPRSVDLFIRRDYSRLRLTWEPGFCSYLDAMLGIEDYSDGNQRHELLIAPRWAYRRTDAYNLDLGVRAQWLHYDRQFNNGYYDPDEYIRLWGMAYYYRKLNDNDGVSVVLGLGPERDPDLDSGYKLGGDLSVEGTFGVYRDWQLKLRAAYGAREDSDVLDGGGFNGYSLGIGLIYRF